MIKILFKLLILLPAISQAHLINTTCTNEEFPYPALSVCKILPNNQSIHYENTSIILNNVNKSLEGLIVEDMDMYYIPKGIENFIETLELLIIKNTKLRKIRKENLENFTNLIYLDLSFNQIEILENGLFSANKNLSSIILNSNNIRVVEDKVFYFLENLNRIDFRNNECYSGMTDVKEEIVFLVKQIQTVCLNYNLKLWNHISNNNEKFDNLTQENVKMRQKLTYLSENFSSKLNLSARLSSENLLLLIVLLFIGGVALIILALVIICLNLKTLNHQMLKILKNRVQPNETVINFTKPNDCEASFVDTSKDDGEDFYQELPHDEITSARVANKSEINGNNDETYSEVGALTELIKSNEAEALYATVNKN